MLAQSSATNHTASQGSLDNFSYSSLRSDARQHTISCRYLCSYPQKYGTLARSSVSQVKLHRVSAENRVIVPAKPTHSVPAISKNVWCKGSPTCNCGGPHILQFFCPPCATSAQTVLGGRTAVCGPLVGPDQSMGPGGLATPEAGCARTSSNRAAFFAPRTACVRRLIGVAPWGARSSSLPGYISGSAPRAVSCS